ncbi:MAG: lactonase family protein [Armatimonadetes bacterium]|nr:lactonase family protein [Armatimonadota bacterium]
MQGQAIIDQRAIPAPIFLAIVALLLVGCARGETAPSHLAFVEVKRSGTGGVEGLRGVWSLTVSPDGRHVYAAGYRDDAVVVFGRDQVTGRLAFVEAHKDGSGNLDGIAGACSIAVSPDGRHVYVAGHWDHAVAVFSRDRATGSLAFVEAQRDGIAGVDGLQVVNWVAASPDGKHVYAAGYRDDAVAAFRRDAATGRLAFVGVYRDGVGGVDGLHGAFHVTVSPDGEHVYAAGYLESAVAAFRRDRATGRLIFVEARRDGVGGANGMRGPSSVSLSPDGRHIYVAGASDSAVAVFSRDSRTGRLAFVEAQQDDIGSVDGLQGVKSVAVSPNGRYLYAAGWGEHALAVFTRDGVTGRLTFMEAQQDGVAGVDGLQGASCVAVSPDGVGRYVYVAGNWARAVSVFRVLRPRDHRRSWPDG